MASSTVDRRRFQGPETSSPIRFIRSQDKGKQPETALPPLLNTETGLRQDDRKPEDIRPIYLKTGLVPQASGSAYIETGKTKIVCAVYGPHPTRKDAPFSAKAKLNVEVKWTPFASPGRRRVPGKDTEALGLSSQLAQALIPSLRLDLLPKSAIDLYVTILECDGPLDDMSSGVTAASVALAQAGVQMYGFVVGCSAALTSIDGTLQPFLDPTYQEAKQASGIASLACMPAMASATNISFSGSAPRSTVKAIIAGLQETAAHIHTLAVQAIQESEQSGSVNGAA
ncbi:ribosomal protein S5 domain 2-like protein [Cystobasidium minutum MCA 4210]|uniref:ribosomal protein S5 domain 2-like protein n=1 Tax=Cystobasidium minutum MCA 4210 TaxID=1397322 RepID=UPI0034CFF468|eukprot:jgi/Rhomi1/56/CE55_242